MSKIAYYLLWLTGGLLIIAIISAAITRQLRLRVRRRLNAAQALDALARYADWVAAQRGCSFFQGEGRKGDSPLLELHAMRRWFPELSADIADILAVHVRLIDFLWSQQMLRLRDPEAWLESDHDTEFMDLWRQHLRAVQAMVEKLELLLGAGETGRQGTTFAA